MAVKISKTSNAFIHLGLALFSIMCVLPLLLVLAISLTSETEIIRNGYSIWPKELSLKAYSVIFKNPDQILNAYMVTIIVTLVGTALSVLITSMLAYTISRKDYPFANKTSFYIFFTMLFSGGMVPWYIIVTQVLHLNDKLIGLIVPYLVIPWYVILMKGFFSTMPMSIIESAKMDGANEYHIFFGFVIPLNKPGIATVALFCALTYWNDYWLSLFLISNSKNVSLQFLLFRIMSNVDFLTSALALKAGVKTNIDMPSQSARMAICILAAGPMMFIFPFFQKYFVKGITVGAIKG